MTPQELYLKVWSTIDEAKSRKNQLEERRLKIAQCRRNNAPNPELENLLAEGIVAEIDTLVQKAIMAGVNHTAIMHLNQGYEYTEFPVFPSGLKGVGKKVYDFCLEAKFDIRTEYWGTAGSGGYTGINLVLHW